MCMICGVTTEQVEAARRVLHFRATASWYRSHGSDPADFEIEEYADRRVRTATELVERYGAAHPGRATTREQWDGWTTRWTAERERALAARMGC